MPVQATLAEVLLSVQRRLDDPVYYQAYVQQFVNDDYAPSGRTYEYFFKTYLHHTSPLYIAYQKALSFYQSKYFQFFSRGPKTNITSVNDPTLTIQRTLGQLNFQLWCIENDVRRAYEACKDQVEDARRIQSYTSKESKHEIGSKSRSKDALHSKKKATVHNGLVDALDASNRTKRHAKTGCLMLRPRNGEFLFRKKIG